MCACNRRIMRALVTNQSRIPQKKCEQYWPDEGCEEYGPISVQLLDTEELPDFTIRTFLLSKVSLIYVAQKREQLFSQRYFVVWSWFFFLLVLRWFVRLRRATLSQLAFLKEKRPKFPFKNNFSVGIITVEIQNPFFSNFDARFDPPVNTSINLIHQMESSRRMEGIVLRPYKSLVRQTWDRRLIYREVGEGGERRGETLHLPGIRGFWLYIYKPNLLIV